MDESLESLLYIPHDKDRSGSSNENVHLYVFSLMFNILQDKYEYKKIKYYKRSKAFKMLCQTVKDNIPKSIYVKDKYGDYMIDTKNKKYPLYVVLSHAIKYALIELGF